MSGLTHVSLAGMTSTPQGSYQYSFDRADRVTRMQSTSAAGAVTNSDFRYDAIDQLTAADHTSVAPDEAFAYDKNGNRSGLTYDNFHRLTNDGTYTYEYNNEGTLKKRTKIVGGEYTQYLWDFRNRLAQIDVFTAAGVRIRRAEYKYDAFDRRIETQVDMDGGTAFVPVVTDYVYDGDDVLLSRDSAGGVTHRYLQGPLVDQVLADEKLSSPTSAGEVRWALADHQQSVRRLVKSDGTAVADILYDSFGKVPAGTTTPDAVDFLFGYTGQVYDKETGLSDYKGRYYDPQTSHFLSEDPAHDGVNPYRYVGNDPLNRVDPTGMATSYLGGGLGSTISAFGSALSSFAGALANSATAIASAPIRAYAEASRQAQEIRGTLSSFGSAVGDAFWSAAVATSNSLEGIGRLHGVLTNNPYVGLEDRPIQFHHRSYVDDLDRSPIDQLADTARAVRIMGGVGADSLDRRARTTNNAYVAALSAGGSSLVRGGSELVAAPYDIQGQLDAMRARAIEFDRDFRQTGLFVAGSRQVGLYPATEAYFGVDLDELQLQSRVRRLSPDERIDRASVASARVGQAAGIVALGLEGLGSPAPLSFAEVGSPFVGRRFFIGAEPSSNVRSITPYRDPAPPGYNTGAIHIDHAQARSLGGINAPSNLRPLAAETNLRKGGYEGQLRAYEQYLIRNGMSPRDARSVIQSEIDSLRVSPPPRPMDPRVLDQLPANPLDQARPR